MPGTRKALYRCLGFVWLLAAPCFVQALHAESTVEQFLTGMVQIHTTVPASASSAERLGTRRQGNGVLLDSSGLIATVDYLVMQAESIELTASGGQQLTASLVGIDNASGLALIRAQADQAVLDRLQPVQLAGSDSVPRTGDSAVVVDYRGTESAAVVEVVSLDSFSGSYEMSFPLTLRTTPLYEPFSGAALIDRDSGLLGIGALRLSSAAANRRPAEVGNLFIPARGIPALIADLLIDGEAEAVTRPWLGVNLSLGSNSILVKGVLDNSPAAIAGLRAGDEIIALDKIRVRDNQEFLQRLWSQVKPQDTLDLLISRQREIITLELQAADIHHRASFYSGSNH